MPEIPTTLLAVAGALRRGDGRWLLQKRPAHKHYGGWWEVPGGKVEPGELPADALARELMEELGIAVAPGAMVPATFASGPREDATGALVILLYTLTDWSGEPRAVETGAEIGWFTAAEFATLRLPPLDVLMCAVLAGHRLAE